MAITALSDKRVLVVEDEFLLADDLHRDLQRIGVIVVGPAPSVERAISLIRADTAIDAAVLDVNLGGTMAYVVADELLARRVPFVFTSGYDDDVLERRYPTVLRCKKPTEFAVIAGMLLAALAG